MPVPVADKKHVSYALCSRSQSAFVNSSCIQIY